MARVNYHGILQAMKTIFENDSRTSEGRVFVEQDPQFGMADNPKAVCLVLNNRVSSAGQPIAAGKRNRFDVFVSAWSVGFSAESFEKAAEVRDEHLGQMELVLMDNRKLRVDDVEYGEAVQLEGGRFMSAKDDNGMIFCALAEIIVKVQATAINA
jgi:hypothetical protein